MPWEYKRNYSVPRWHDHPIRGKGRRSQKIVPPLYMVTRKEWQALPNTDENHLDIPVNHVRLIETHTEQCTTKEDCIKLLQRLQEEHMRNSMPDIQYNFMIGGDGNVYEGRGWKLDASRDLDYLEALEEDCIDIAYIGTFLRLGEDIPDEMKAKARDVIDHGLQKKYIDCCYKEIPFKNYE